MHELFIVFQILWVHMNSVCVGLKGLTRPFLSSTSIGPYTFSTPFLQGSLSSDGKNLIETFHLVRLSATVIGIKLQDCILRRGGRGENTHVGYLLLWPERSMGSQGEYAIVGGWGNVVSGTEKNCWVWGRSVC